MNKKIVFVADYFAEDILGGGELNNEEVILLLKQNNYDVLKIHSHLVTVEFLENNKECFFIIANFINLNLKSKKYLRELNYLIYEHDHKYLRSRNPAVYKNFKAPERDILNFHFYKKAKAILSQSQFHKNIINKNLSLNNVINLGGNLWSLESLEKMREISKRKKNDQCSILQSRTPHKNTEGSIKHCLSNSIKYELVSSPDYFKFLEKLGSNQKFIFLPKTPETLSRVVVEARMMGCSVMVNDLIGATSEPWFNLKGEELIDFMIRKREEIFSVIDDIVKNNSEKNNKPLVSIISTFCDGEEYLKNFLNNMVEQTFYNNCELIIVDANSQGKERDIIKSYEKKYNNIIYIRCEEKLPPTPCLNLAIKNASADFITFGLIDDVKKKDCIETLYNNIIDDETVDLVYGDVLQTKDANKKFDEIPNSAFFDHSKYNFSRENMIKCLPGPMPLWRKDMHEKCGLFDSKDCNYADDWEMWLRAVEAGSRFKKIHEVVGAYLLGGRSQKSDMEQRKEEARIFYKYKRVFGYNYEKFKPYFDQF